MNKVLKTLICIYIAIFASLAHASEPIITKSFTGGWHDPSKNGQGFLLEIIRSNNQKKALTTWFTFDTSGNQYWLIGVGEIQGQSINFEMLLPQGGQFGDAHDPSNMTNTYWGDVKFNFTSCNNGTVNWEPQLPGFGSGSMQIIRTTAINNLNCTGGLFDELGDTLEETEIITPLTSTGVDSDANGKTKYEQRTDRIDYSVEIEDLPVGVYELYVGDIKQGLITVVSQNDGSTEGEIEFRDPVEPGKLPLDFDPQGKVVDIVQNNVVYLTTDGSNGGSNNGGNTSENAPPFGNSESVVYMLNAGITPLGKAKTKLEQRSDRVDFQIELEDVPVGFYDFNVNGSVEGVIEVTQTAAGIEGELEYRNPVEAGKELLDFNPLGQSLSVTQGSTVFFTLNFPSTPGNGDDDNDCENGSGDDCNDNDDCADGSGNDDCDDDNNTQLVEIELDFNNSGLDSDASGSVEYEVRSDRKDFKVEVEDLNFGTYQLVVGGATVASFNVNDDEVELEFRDPVEPDKLPLDFDPLNQLIEVKQSGNVYLSVLLQ
ncbi:hypothetical protein OS175_05880 [Marinicella sp. S1101]|uniref:hypothetical protein n=1 Tax=Marinicella marina TaxID=2996016 RepID=UPI002260E05A|nr:hypothetical protein [Marinicella marina]MCX7553401.1 hypothetical protein [Marinicella marina]MDJ1140024.1 hypothetical protein [Marinicella marina]